MRFLIAIWLCLLGPSGFAATATVQDDIRANLRSGRGEEYRLITVLPARTQVEVLREENSYTQVKTTDGQVGWLPARMLVIDKEATPRAPSDQGNELEKLRGELLAAQAEVARLQAVQAQAAPAAQGKGGEKTWLLVLVALAAGVVLGMFLRERHYRKRLHGLRV